MTTPTQILSNLENSPQFNIAPKPYVLQSREFHRRQSPAAELLQENNSLLSSRINASLLIPASIPRPGNSSGCRGLKRERAPTAISVAKDYENLKSESEIMSMEGIKALSSKPPLSAGQAAAKENQGRCQAPMRMRKNSSMAEPKSAMLPSSSTGKLIERSRQKVAEKHASKDFGPGGVSLMSTLTEREGTGNQQDQLLSMIELTKNSLYRDQKMIRHCMNKHKKAVGSVEQRQYEKSFEGRKI